MVVDSSTRGVVAMVNSMVATNKGIKGHLILLLLFSTKIRCPTQRPKEVWVHKLLQCVQSMKSSIRVNV